jgi:urease accessory protein UreF
MAIHPHIALPTTARLLGDPARLAAQLGSTHGRVALGRDTARQQSCAVTDLPCLREFLQGYQSQVLFPVEFPAICRAHAHASRHEVRELIALDASLNQEAPLRAFAFASQAVGRSHLRRLRPLRDQRLVRRYWQAVQAGQAYGWHMLVYGVVLCLYSLPLRPGLLSYAQQTLGGFLDAAGSRLALQPDQRQEILGELGAALPPAVEAALAPWNTPRLLKS